MKDLPPPIRGYPKLACHMGTHPESAIFRRFGDLNAKNLLYLQAELVHLEKKLRSREIIDSEAQQGNSSSYARDWYWLNNSAFGENNDQIQIVLEIRTKLREYNGTLMQQVAMAGLSQPSRYDFGSLQDWLGRPKMGDLALIGADRHVWGSVDDLNNGSPDLIVLKPRTRRSLLGVGNRQVSDPVPLLSMASSQEDL